MGQMPVSRACKCSSRASSLSCRFITSIRLAGTLEIFCVYWYPLPAHTLNKKCSSILCYNPCSDIFQQAKWKFDGNFMHLVILQRIWEDRRNWVFFKDSQLGSEWYAQKLALIPPVPVQVVPVQIQKKLNVDCALQHGYSPLLLCRRLIEMPNLGGSMKSRIGSADVTFVLWLSRRSNLGRTGKKYVSSSTCGGNGAVFPFFSYNIFINVRP